MKQRTAKKLLVQRFYKANLGGYKFYRWLRGDNSCCPFIIMKRAETVT